MAAGKNKVERWLTLKQDDSAGTPRDLSADLVPGTLQGGGLVFDEAEMTGVSEAVRNYLADHANSELAADFYLNDTATTGAHTVFNGMVGKVNTLTLDFGAGAAPTTGDPEWNGEYLVLQAALGITGNKPVIHVKWKPGTSAAPAWGTKP